MSSSSQNSPLSGGSLTGNRADFHTHIAALFGIRCEKTKTDQLKIAKESWQPGNARWRVKQDVATRPSRKQAASIHATTHNRTQLGP